MNIISTVGFRWVLAQAAQTVPNQTAAQLKFFMMMGLVLVVMWVLMIAPQRKKAKEQEVMIKALKAGDRVVTSSGIIGVILTVKEKSVSMRSADTKLEVLKSAITEVTGGEASES